MKKTIKNIVVFASGSGSNAIKIYEYFQNNQSVNIEALYCNKKSAPVIQKFQNIRISTIVYEKNNLDDGRVLKTLINLNPSIIILAPFDENDFTSSRPMPLVAPVIIIFFP